MELFRSGSAPPTVEGSTGALHGADVFLDGHQALAPEAEAPPSPSPREREPRPSRAPAPVPFRTRVADASLEPAVPVDCWAGHGVTAMDVSGLAALALTTCLTECSDDDDNKVTTVVAPGASSSTTALLGNIHRSLLLLGDHQAIVPPEPPPAPLVQEQIGGNGDQVASQLMLANVALIRVVPSEDILIGADFSVAAKFPTLTTFADPSNELPGEYLICFEDTRLALMKLSQVSMEVFTSQPWPPPLQVELCDREAGQPPWPPPKTCIVFLLLGDNYITPLIELKPWPDPQLSQSSGSVVNKLQHYGFWMSNLLHVLPWRTAGANDLLNNYTEKQLLGVVLELHRVAAGCSSHVVNLELKILKLYEMVSGNPNTTPRTWDPGILEVVHMVSSFPVCPAVHMAQVFNQDSAAFVFLGLEHLHVLHRGHSTLISRTAAIVTFFSSTFKYKWECCAGRQWDPGIFLISGKIVANNISTLAKKYCNKLLCFLHTPLPDHAFAKLLNFWSRVLPFILLVSDLSPGQQRAHVLGTPDGQVFLQGKVFGPLKFTTTTKAISIVYWWQAVHGMPSLQGYNALFPLFILTAHIQLNLQPSLLTGNTMILHGFSHSYKYNQSSFTIQQSRLLIPLALELQKGSTGSEVQLYHQTMQGIWLAHFPPSNSPLRWTACGWITESSIASVYACGKDMLQLLLELDNSEHRFHGIWSIFTQTSISCRDASEALVCQDDKLETYCIPSDLLFGCAPASTCCMLAHSVCVCQEDMLETHYCQEITQYYSVEFVSPLSVQSAGLRIILGCPHSTLLGQLLSDHYHCTPNLALQSHAFILFTWPSTTVSAIQSAWWFGLMAREIHQGGRITATSYGVKTSLLLQYELLWRQPCIVLEDKQNLKGGRVSCPGSMTCTSMCPCVWIRCIGMGPRGQRVCELL